MKIEGFLPKEEQENTSSYLEVKKEEIEKITQDQFYDMLLKKELSWQEIIYDLIKTEQLDPWNINLAVLSNRYLEKIQELEEANFFVSSKVLLAASLLLRIKSEILLNEYIRGLDDILFGKKEEKKYIAERIDLDESELPILNPKTPLPRFRQVTLNELMSALNKAINTENRRIKKEVQVRQAERLSHVDIPKSRVNIRDRIRKLYAQIYTFFKKKPQTRLSYTDLAGKEKENRIACFLPVLHLSNQEKIWLTQENHFEEIWILMYEHYKKEVAIEGLQEDIQEITEELDDEQKQRIEKINKDFENPLANFFDLQSEIIKGRLN